MKRKLVQYETNIPVLLERQSEADDKLQESIVGKFEVGYQRATDHVCGNVSVCFRDGKARLGASRDESKGDVASYRQISSALALYRAISIFKTGSEPARQDFYKCNWSVTLRHKESGKLLMLGEWKGGFQIFTEASALKDLPKSFVKDVEEFLTWFVSDKVAIGYDGTIAGSVA